MVIISKQVEESTNKVAGLFSLNDIVGNVDASIRQPGEDQQTMVPNLPGESFGGIPDEVMLYQYFAPDQRVEGETPAKAEPTKGEQMFVRTWLHGRNWEAIFYLQRYYNLLTQQITDTDTPARKKRRWTATMMRLLQYWSACGTQMAAHGYVWPMVAHFTLDNDEDVMTPWTAWFTMTSLMYHNDALRLYSEMRAASEPMIPFGIAVAQQMIDQSWMYLVAAFEESGYDTVFVPYKSPYGEKTRSVEVFSAVKEVIANSVRRPHGGGVVHTIHSLTSTDGAKQRLSALHDAFQSPEDFPMTMRGLVGTYVESETYDWKKFLKALNTTRREKSVKDPETVLQTIREGFDRLRTKAVPVENDFLVWLAQVLTDEQMSVTKEELAKRSRQLEELVSPGQKVGTASTVPEQHQLLRNVHLENKRTKDRSLLSKSQKSITDNPPPTTTTIDNPPPTTTIDNPPPTTTIDNPPAHPPTNTPAHPPAHPPAHTPAHPPAHTPAHPPAHPPTNTPAHTPAHPPTNTPAHPPTNTPAHTSVNTPAHTPTNPPTNSRPTIIPPSFLSDSSIPFFKAILSTFTLTHPDPYIREYTTLGLHYRKLIQHTITSLESRMNLPVESLRYPLEDISTDEPLHYRRGFLLKHGRGPGPTTTNSTPKFQAVSPAEINAAKKAWEQMVHSNDWNGFEGIHTQCPTTWEALKTLLEVIDQSLEDEIDSIRIMTLFTRMLYPECVIFKLQLHDIWNDDSIHVKIIHLYNRIHERMLWIHTHTDDQRVQLLALVRWGNERMWASIGTQGVLKRLWHWMCSWISPEVKLTFSHYAACIYYFVNMMASAFVATVKEIIPLPSWVQAIAMQFIGWGAQKVMPAISLVLPGTNAELFQWNFIQSFIQGSLSKLVGFLAMRGFESISNEYLQFNFFDHIMGNQKPADPTTASDPVTEFALKCGVEIWSFINRRQQLNTMHQVYRGQDGMQQLFASAGSAMWTHAKSIGMDALFSANYGIGGVYSYLSPYLPFGSTTTADSKNVSSSIITQLLKNSRTLNSLSGHFMQYGIILGRWMFQNLWKQKVGVWLNNNLVYGFTNVALAAGLILGTYATGGFATLLAPAAINGAYCLEVAMVLNGLLNNTFVLTTGLRFRVVMALEGEIARTGYYLKNFQQSQSLPMVLWSVFDEIKDGLCYLLPPIRNHAIEVKNWGVLAALLKGNSTVRVMDMLYSMFQMSKQIWFTGSWFQLVGKSIQTFFADPYTGFMSVVKSFNRMDQWIHWFWNVRHLSGVTYNMAEYGFALSDTVVEQVEQFYAIKDKYTDWASHPTMYDAELRKKLVGILNDRRYLFSMKTMKEEADYSDEVLEAAFGKYGLSFLQNTNNQQTKLIKVAEAYWETQLERYRLLPTQFQNNWRFQNDHLTVEEVKTCNALFANKEYNIGGRDHVTDHFTSQNPNNHIFWKMASSVFEKPMHPSHMLAIYKIATDKFNRVPTEEELKEVHRAYYTEQSTNYQHNQNWWNQNTESAIRTETILRTAEKIKTENPTVQLSKPQWLGVAMEMVSNKTTDVKDLITKWDDLKSKPEQENNVFLFDNFYNMTLSGWLFGQDKLGIKVLKNLGKTNVPESILVGLVAKMSGKEATHYDTSEATFKDTLLNDPQVITEAILGIRDLDRNGQLSLTEGTFEGFKSTVTQWVWDMVSPDSRKVREYLDDWHRETTGADTFENLRRVGILGTRFQQQVKDDPSLRVENMLSLLKLGYDYHHNRSYYTTNDVDMVATRLNTLKPDAAEMTKTMLGMAIPTGEKPVTVDSFFNSLNQTLEFQDFFIGTPTVYENVTLEETVAEWKDKHKPVLDEVEMDEQILSMLAEEDKKVRAEEERLLEEHERLKQEEEKKKVMRAAGTPGRARSRSRSLGRAPSPTTKRTVELTSIWAWKEPKDEPLSSPTPSFLWVPSFFVQLDFTAPPTPTVPITEEKTTVDPLLEYDQTTFAGDAPLPFYIAPVVTSAPPVDPPAVKTKRWMPTRVLTPNRHHA